MKNIIYKLALTSVILISVLSLFSCSNGSSDPKVLTVINGKDTKTYSMSQLKKLPVFSGYGGQIDMNDTITGPTQYVGVALNDLLDTVGGITANDSVKITAKDNNTVMLSYTQVTNGSFTIFNAATGQQATSPSMTPKAFIAYENNGTPLAADTGPLEFGIMTCQYRVTQESQWVKQVAKIEVLTGQ
jgi:hypothetical protein